MKYMVQPSALTDITQSDKFFDVIAAMQPTSPAVEFFGFTASKESGFNMSKIDIKSLNSGSIKIISGCVDNLDRALSDWEHRLSKEMNECISKLFGVNKARIKLLNNDLKERQSEARKIQSALRQGGMPDHVRDDLQHQEQEILDRVEETKALIQEMRIAVLISGKMFQSVQQSTDLSKKGIKMLFEEYARYQKTVDARNKETDLRFGTISDDDYIREMVYHRMSLTDPEAELLRNLSQLISEATRINETQIFNIEVNLDPNLAMRYDLKVTNEISEVYNTYRKMTAKIHKRIQMLKADCRRLTNNQKSVNSSMMIAQEIVFLTAFCMKYSDFLLLYLRPQFGIIEAGTKATFVN